MGLLGLDASAKLVDKLFDLFDPDRSGEIEYKQFSMRLKKSHSICEAGDTSNAKPLYYKTRNPVPSRQVSTISPQKSSALEVLKAESDKAAYKARAPCPTQSAVSVTATLADCSE